MRYQRKVKLANKVIIADNFFSRARGLMFRKEKKDTAMVLSFKKPGRYSIHMFFVLFPIDVLWLDEKKRIMQMNEHVVPWTPCVSPKTKISYIVELSSGTLKNIKIKNSMVLKFSPGSPLLVVDGQAKHL